MRRIILASLLALPVSALSATGILAEATNDTVMKIKYTGGSPSSTTHPAVTIEGKILGLSVTAPYTSNSVAITGKVSSVYGQLGTANAGVYGYGPIGVHGNSSDGVYGVGGYNGVSGAGHESGITGWGLNQYALAGYFMGDVYVSGNVTEGSDLGLKKNVRPINRGLAAVLSLQPKVYEMKEGITRVTSKGDRFGLIAQEVQSIIPEIVKKTRHPSRRDADGKIDSTSPRPEYLSMNYTGLIPILVKAIQEQQAAIQKQQTELEAMRGEIARLKSR